ncbi:MAG: hypothetical protein IT293_11385 [Deltaproteobacteria bacterium]|nr:hypothetical protein [Deltaproteobacteria bacterium]
MTSVTPARPCLLCTTRPRAEQKGRPKITGPVSVKYVRSIVNGTLRAMILDAMVDDLVTRDLFVGLKWPAWRQPEADPFAVDEVRRIVEHLRVRRYGFAPLPGSRGVRRLPHPAARGRFCDVSPAKCPRCEAR